MLSRAHIGVGVAVALAVVRPADAVGCVVCVLGAAAGSLICDIDVRPNERRHDLFVAGMALVAATCVLFAYDLGRGAQLTSSVVAHFGPEAVTGALVFVGTCVLGALMPHRTFAHSLVALALWSASLRVLAPALSIPFAVGVASHLLLDLTTKRGIQLFWPLKTEVSLGLWKSDGFMNNVLAILGLCTVVVLFAMGVMG